FRIALDEAWPKIRKQAKHIVQHQNLPVTGGRGTDADRRDIYLSRDASGERLRHFFQHDGESASFGNGKRVLRNPLTVISPPLDSVTTEGVDRLRRQPDVGHHGNAARDEKADRFGHALPAFELDSRATGLRT